MNGSTIWEKLQKFFRQHGLTSPRTPPLIYEIFNISYQMWKVANFKNKVSSLRSVHIKLIVRICRIYSPKWKKLIILTEVCIIVLFDVIHCYQRLSVDLSGQSVYSVTVEFFIFIINIFFYSLVQNIEYFCCQKVSWRSKRITNLHI